MRLAQTLILSLALAWAAYGQHSFTPEDIAAGAQLYRANCLKLTPQELADVIGYLASLKTQTTP